MKKSTFALTALALLTLSTTTYAEDGITAQSRDYKLPRCEKPLGTLVIGKITCKADACQTGSASNANNPMAQLIELANRQRNGGSAPVGNIGGGLSDMLTTALKESGCFDVQEREAMDEINKELALAGKKVEAQQADYLVTGSITSVEVNTDSKGVNLGMIPGAGIFGAVLGQVGATTKKASLSLDIRVIDVSKAKVLDSKTIDANSENTSFGIGGGGYGTMTGLPGGFGGSLSSLKGTSLEAASREAIANSTIFIANTLFKARGVKPIAAQ